MKRFNLLFVNCEQKTKQFVGRSLAKNFKKKMIFDLNAEDDPRKVLDKISIDMIIVNLQNSKVLLDYIQDSFPNMMVVALYDDLHVPEINHPAIQKLIQQNHLEYVFPSEMKAIKREMTETAENRPPSYQATPSFSDYFVLAGVEGA